MNSFNWLAIREGKFIGDVSYELCKLTQMMPNDARVNQLTKHCLNSLIEEVAWYLLSQLPSQQNVIIVT